MAVGMTRTASSVAAVSSIKNLGRRGAVHRDIEDPFFVKLGFRLCGRSLREVFENRDAIGVITDVLHRRDDRARTKIDDPHGAARWSVWR